MRTIADTNEIMFKGLEKFSAFKRATPVNAVEIKIPWRKLILKSSFGLFTNPTSFLSFFSRKLRTQYSTKAIVPARLIQAETKK